jgi:uncharacterized protein YycO
MVKGKPYLTTCSLVRNATNAIGNKKKADNVNDEKSDNNAFSRFVKQQPSNRS